MEFALALGYLAGVGADWPTILVTLGGCLIVAVIAKALGLGE